MSEEDIIVAAALWDEEAIARAAMEWVDSRSGAALLKLKPSQFAALSRSVAGAASPGELVKRLEGFLGDQASHEKRRSVWHELMDELPEAVRRAAAAAVDRSAARGDSFDNCRRLLKRAGRGENIPGIERRRELGAMRGFLSALARRYRGRKHYGGIS